MTLGVLASLGVRRSGDEGAREREHTGSVGCVDGAESKSAIG